MRLRSSIISCLILFFLGQTPQDTIRQHYEAAEAARAAGNLDASESEYALILVEGYQHLGRIYSTRSEYQAAVTSLEVALKYRPDSVAVLLDTSIAYFGAEQYQKALAAASRATALDANSPGAHQMLGKTYFMLGDVDKAVVELEAATKLAPDDIDVAYTLGIAYLRNRRSADARKLYEELAKRLGDQPQVHVVIGRAYRQSGMLVDAAQEFKKAIALDPRYPRAHYYLGMTYLLDEGQSKIGEALEEFKIEAAANPDEFLGNYYLGVVYNFQRQWALAITFLQKAVLAQPNNPDPYFQLGQAYQEISEHEKAVAALRKAIAYNPNLAHNKSQVTSAHHRLAQSLLKLGQTEEGRKELQEAADLKAKAFKLEQRSQADGRALAPEEATERLALADQKRTEGKDLDDMTRQELQNSEAYYKKVIGRAHNNIGLLRAERQDVIAAAEQFALAAKWDPQQDGVNYNLGLAYYKAQYYKRAVSPLESELMANPANRPARMLLGLVQFRLANYAKASEALSRVIDQQSSDANLYYHLAASLIRQRKNADADKMIEQMKLVAGDSPQFHLLMAEKNYLFGNSAQAVAELGQAVLVAGNQPFVHYYSGLLYLNLKKQNEAIREFESELSLNPNDVEARYALGKSHLEKGDLTRAIQNLEQASKLDPDNAEMQYDLGRAYLAAGRKAEGKTHIDISERLKRSRAQTPGN